MEIYFGNRIRLAHLSTWVIVIESFIHLLNYSDPICVIFLALSQLVGVAILYRGNVFKPTALMCLYFIARYLAIASVVKLALGHPLQSQLYRPRESFLMNFIVIVQLYLAYRIVERLRVRTPLLPPVDRDSDLTFFSYACLAIGTVAMFFMAHQIKAEPDYGGFFMFSDSIYTMGVILSVFHLHRRTGGKKVIDIQLLFMLVTTVVFAFVSGTKFVAFNCMVAYIITLLCLRRSLPVWFVAVGTASIVLLVVVVAPTINYLREAEGMNQKNLAEKIAVLSDFFANRSISDTTKEFADEQDSTLHYQHYFGSVGLFAPFADRIGMVQNADALMTGLDVNGYMGSYLITEAFVRLLPRVLYPDKDWIATCDYIVWHAGLRPTSSIGYPTVGVIGGCYAVSGWPAVCVLPLVLFTTFFAVMRWLTGDSSTSVWAIYLFVNYSHKFVENDVTPFLQNFNRNIPLDIAALYLLFLFSRYASYVLRPKSAVHP